MFDIDQISANNTSEVATRWLPRLWKRATRCLPTNAPLDSLSNPAAHKGVDVSKTFGVVYNSAEIPLFPFRRRGGGRLTLRGSQDAPTAGASHRPLRNAA